MGAGTESPWDGGSLEGTLFPESFPWSALATRDTLPLPDAWLAPFSTLGAALTPGRVTCLTLTPRDSVRGSPSLATALGLTCLWGIHAAPEASPVRSRPR